MHADQIHIPTPCHEDWDAMRPEGARRFCDSCTQHVHDLSAMTHDEAQALMDSGDDVCVRFAQRPDGELVHRPEVRHVQAAPRVARRRGGWLRRAAAAALGATVMSSPAQAGSVIAEVEEEPSWLRQAVELAIDWLEGEEEEAVRMGQVTYELPPPPPPEPPVMMGAPPVPDRRPLKGKPLRVEPEPEPEVVPEPVVNPERKPASNDVIPELSE